MAPALSSPAAGQWSIALEVRVDDFTLTRMGGGFELAD
jgi:hypothetical protein